MTDPATVLLWLFFFCAMDLPSTKNRSHVRIKTKTSTSISSMDPENGIRHGIWKDEPMKPSRIQGV